MYLIGKINRKIYKCITKDILADEVIITDERINHIKENHPSDYEIFYGYLKRIVEHPDYIIETNKPNSAIVLKEILNSTENKYFKMIIRITTSTDNKDFKNSIITFMKIDRKEWSRLIRNKKILYKNDLQC